MTFPVLPSNGSSGYNLTKSLRFRRSASAYLNRTFSTPTNGTTWTISYWAKLGILNRANHFAPNLSTNEGGISIESDYALYINPRVGTVGGAGTNYFLGTTQLFRDPSAWYHIVVAIDTTQATSSNRVKLYVNGTQVTAFSTTNYPPQNSTPIMGSAVSHAIGRVGESGYEYYYDGLFGEMNYVDGQALTPSSFGSFNSLTGVWQPAKYTGTYGTNGFYLPFTNITSTTTLGYDFSGNSNNWTTNNLSLTAGTTYDSMTDVPTLTSATAANYCVLNPLENDGSPKLALSNGNLTATKQSTTEYALSSFIMSSGKWYAEAVVSTTTNVASTSISVSTDIGGNGSLGGYRKNGGTYGLTGSPTFNTYTNGDIIGVAFDCDNRTVAFYKNGTVQGTGQYAYTGTAPIAIRVSIGADDSAGAWNVNFGQQGFIYTPPTGFVALNTYNLPTSTIVKGNTVMDATTYAGNNSTQSVTNTASFKPDLVWVKNRTNAFTHLLYDSVRGVGTLKAISSSETTAEGGMSDNSTFGYLSALNSNGFTVVSGSTANSYTNSLNNNYVGWQWQAGQGTTSSNTSGSITSTVSVNATAGFSVVTYTGNGTLGATVGHGLGVAPSLVIVKTVNIPSPNYGWQVYTSALGATKTLVLNSTSASITSTGFWNDTAPTSSVFSLGNDWDVNKSSTTYIAYCWSQIAGFSSFGSYTGNGSSDGSFLYLGFRPKYILIKSTGVQDWIVWDTARDTYNASQNFLQPNRADAESGGIPIDFVSNGVKIRTANGTLNSNGVIYIYMAFAENPFKNALAR